MKITMKSNQKVWWKSRTIWSNILLIVIGVLTGIVGELEAGATITVAGIVNIFLRTITKSELKL